MDSVPAYRSRIVQARLLDSGGDPLAEVESEIVIDRAVNDTTAQTPEQLGVGSRLQQLRSAYGEACADLVGDTVVVTFADAPGAHYALDTPAPQDTAQLRGDPGQLPDDAQVTRWWLDRDAERCTP